MTNTPEEQRQKNDWKKKGLGWVPDYPDLRDYSLDDEEIRNQKRLKVEETTEHVENLVGILGEIIAALGDSTPRKNISKIHIDEIRNRIFGDVVFTKVKVHKLLRLTTTSTEKLQSARYTLNIIPYESILSKQIIELKKYFGILFLSKYLPFPQELEGSEKNSDTPDPIKVLNWMRNEEYNTGIECIVQEFQRRTNIKPDGIVGLETYTTLNEYYSDSDKLSKLQENTTNNNPKKSLSRIKFFSVTSTIPDKAFEEVIKILYKKAVKQILVEKNNEKKLSSKQSDYIPKVFEPDFLKIIGVEPDFFQEIFHHYEEANIQANKEIESMRISQILINRQAGNKAKNKDKKPVFGLLAHTIETLKNSYLIEPIISVMIKSLSPLSQWKNKTFEELIEQGFDTFDKLLEESYAQENTKLGYTNRELGEQVICKVVYLLKEEIISLTEKVKVIDINRTIRQDAQTKEEKEKEEDFINSVFICFILKKYLNTFKYTNCATEKLTDNKSSNLFDKEEVFEIVEDVQRATEHKNTELFLSLNLYIPIVSNKILHKLRAFNKSENDKNHQKEKPYFLLPAVVDLSYWFSSVKDQGSLNSCTAFAAVSLLEYFANKNSKDKIEPSALFLYKAARNKMDVTGDVGSSIRETMKALALFGVPPEEYWSYDEEKIDEEPPPYCYAFAQNYKTLKYFLLDYAGISKETLLFQIKAVLAAGFPCIFGFTLYTSAYKNSNERGHIPFPDYQEDKIVGGHTLVAVGYDDFKLIKCANSQNYSKGAFLVRNSWGTEWGVDGYGWLPYDYVLAGLTAAWWSLLKSEWFNENNFGLAAIGGPPPDQGKPGH